MTENIFKLDAEQIEIVLDRCEEIAYKIRSAINTIDLETRRSYAVNSTGAHSNQYEIDIIASKDGHIVFVEVKTRKSNFWGYPEDAVSNKKISRIVRAADIYINEFQIDLIPRFDVISIIGNEKNFEIEHFDDAFLPPVN